MGSVRDLTAVLKTAPHALLIPEPFLLVCSKPDMPAPLVSGDATEAEDAARLPQSTHSRECPSPKAEVHFAALDTCHLRSFSFPSLHISLGSFTNPVAFTRR